MNPMETHSHYDAHIEIDQCPECGGLWFDSSELYSIKQGLADIIDRIDCEKLRALVKVAEKINCPRDGAALTLFKDPSFPQEIQIEYCPKCSGLWFNRGEFRDWQTVRAQRMNKVPGEEDERFERDIAGLLSVCGTDSEGDALGRLNNFLATAYNLPQKKSSSQEDAETKDSMHVLSFINSLIGLVQEPSDTQKTKDIDRSEILTKSSRIFSFALKLLAGGLTAYFIISEANIILGTNLQFNELEISIWYFRMLMVFIILPTLYFFKLLNYIQNNYFPGAQSIAVSSSFFQAKIFYYFVYVIILVLFLTRLFGF